MDTFLANAEKILDTAEAATRWPGEASELTFLVGYHGHIEIIAQTDWPLESLCRERGAAAGYRLVRRGGRVTVEGRSLARSCRLESQVNHSMMPAAPPAQVQWLLNR